MKYWRIFLSFIIGAPLVLGANILGLFPLPSKSHFIMYERLCMKLAEAGHNVDIVSHFPNKDEKPRYNQWSLVGSLPILVNNLSLSVVDEFSHYALMHFITRICGIDVCEAVLTTPVFQKLKQSNKKYDLVITELFGADCMLPFGYYFKTPTITLTSSINLPWGSDRFGNPDNPSYIPTYFSSFTAEMNFFERLENTITLISSKLLYYYFTYKDTKKITQRFFGPGMPDVEDLSKNISLILVNSHFSMNFGRPTVPNFIEVGGLHIKDPKPLSPYFEEVMTTDTNKGIIYFSMGSMLMSESMSTNKLQGIFDALENLPYKVLWKADRNSFSANLRIPKNIHFEQWMPQIDILCHRNLKLFISHGGLMGSQEAIYCGVPRVAISIFADQENNVKAAERMKLLVKVAYNDINNKTVSEAVTKVLTDSSYKLNCERLSKQFRDRPLSALDTAVYWIEYVIRHKGAPHLRSAGADLSWHQYYLIDVILFLLISFSLLLYLIYIVTLFFTKILIKTMFKEKKE